MSLLAPDLREIADRDPAPAGLSPNASIVVTAAGALLTLYVLLQHRIRRVEIAHALLKRG